MMIVNSCNNIPIRLTDERWQHIVTRHPEMNDLKKQVLETVTEPDMIQKGDFGESLAIRFYHKTPLTSKFLVVAYREVSPGDGFIITAYLTNEPSNKRIILWKR
jgi:hypothetical protein